MLLRRSVLSKANWLSKWSSRSSALRSYSGTALSSSSAKPMLSYNLLNEQHYDFIDAERELLSDLHRVLQKVDSDSSQENLDLVHDLKSRFFASTSAYRSKTVVDPLPYPALDRAASFVCC